VSDIISEVEQRDLRAATERLQETAAASGSAGMLPDRIGSDSSDEECSTAAFFDELSDAEEQQQRQRFLREDA
jgi:hypothetical protein